MAIISYDEKPGIQAIATTAPDLPPEPGVHATFAREHEYKRHGTVSLLAGIDLVTGKVHAVVKDRHRSREFIEFLKLLDAAYPAHTAIKLILDNVALVMILDEYLPCAHRLAVAIALARTTIDDRGALLALPVRVRLHAALHTEQQAIVRPARVVYAIKVDDTGLHQSAQLKQMDGRGVRQGDAKGVRRLRYRSKPVRAGAGRGQFRPAACRPARQLARGRAADERTAVD